MKITEIVSTNKKSRYRTGLCDIMALAIHELTTLPLGLWRGIFDDDFGDEGDERYEDCHAVVVVSFDPPSWIDVDGMHYGEPVNCIFSEIPKRLELVPASRDEVEQAFTTEDFNNKEFNIAKQYILSDDTLRKLVAFFKK